MFAINFKIDLATTISVKASFVVSQGKSYSCKLFNNDKQEAEKAEEIAESDELQTVSFTFDNLVPNTEYLIDLTANGTNEFDSKNLSISCHTKQSYPANVDNVILTYLEDKNNFQLYFNEVSDWGYWKDSGYGYDIALIINGKIIDVKERNSAYNDDINLVDYFKRYKPLLTDNIQIGVCPWVLYNNKKLYAKDGYKTSKTICLLKQNSISYLN